MPGGKDPKHNSRDRDSDDQYSMTKVFSGSNIVSNYFFIVNAIPYQSDNRSGGT
jgi:hypothetical protein